LKNTKIAIITTDDDDKIECSIIDSGKVFSKDISKVSINFSDLMQQIILKLKEGLGLSIVKKLCLHYH
jgi:anti-sigma regulatory factor (Ser/Thr protein kinase)